VNNGHLLVAYHGCDVTVRDALVKGTLAHLDESKNRYDWLGPGVYFFEGDAQRALRFAQASRDNPAKVYTARPIATASVVGAILRVHTWLDMTTQDGLTEFSAAYDLMLRSMESEDVPPPTNEAASPDDTDILLRHLDKSVFNYIHQVRHEHNAPPYQAVRAAFRQGKELAPRSGFHEGTHLQLALRDPSCVVGWFLPSGQRLYTDHRLKLAEGRLKRAAKDRKLRIQAG